MAFEQEQRDPFEREKKDSRSVAELIETALKENPDLEPQFDPAVHARVVLQARGSREVLEAAKILRRSADPARRELATDIFGELGLPERSFPDECCDELVDMLQSEHDLDVLQSACSAFGHLGNEKGGDALALLAHHPDQWIRKSVAFGLCGSGATSPLAIEALLCLMDDAFERARDWATTAIGQTPEIDGPNIREALLRRAIDSDDMVRAEAINGLARRDDDRAIALLVTVLSDDEPSRHHLLDDGVRKVLGLDEEAQWMTEQALAALRKLMR